MPKPPSMSCNPSLRSLLLALVLGSPAAAELATPQPIIELRPKASDETFSTEFVFENRGSKPVKVLEIQSTCSCLSASLDKAVYQPGEKGKGKADFSLSSFSGRFEKTLHMRTDDPAQPEWVVTFAIEVPELITIKPKTQEWSIDGPAEAKVTKVTINGDEPITITSLSSTREAMQYTLKEVVPGREYEVTMKPRSTAEVMLGAIKIQTNSSIRRYRSQMAFFSVLRGVQSP